MMASTDTISSDMHQQNHSICHTMAIESMVMGNAEVTSLAMVEVCSG